MANAHKPMTLREQCIEAGRDAMGRNDGWRWWAPRHLGRLFDLWEPMIRADEAARHHDGGDCECVSVFTVEEFKNAIRTVLAEEPDESESRAAEMERRYDEVTLALAAVTRERDELLASLLELGRVQGRGTMSATDAGLCDCDVIARVRGDIGERILALPTLEPTASWVWVRRIDVLAILRGEQP